MFSFSAGRPAPAPDKKGEIGEVRALLRDPSSDKDHSRRRHALSRVIALMTMGLDTSSLAADVILASATRDLIVKKMSYLFMAVHADSTQDVTLLSVNSLHKDSSDENPLVRGLAVRTISSILVPVVLEVIVPILQRSLSDASAYVRKIAVIATIKLWQQDRQRWLALSTAVGGLRQRLLSLVRDPDTNVSINAVQAILTTYQDEEPLEVTKPLLYPLLNRLRDMDEWQQLVALKLCLSYVPAETKDLFDVMNLLEERLRGANTAVILSTCHVFLRLTVDHPEIHHQVYDRVKSPLITCSAAAAPEAAYVVLQHLHLMACRQPDVFRSSPQDFFLRLNEPSYIKLVKMNILTEIATDATARDIIAELSEYAADGSVSVSANAIRAMGRIGTRCAAATSVCVPHFLDFLRTDVPHMRAATLVVLKEFLRCLAARSAVELSSFFEVLPSALATTDDDATKASVCWILGEYGESFDPAPYLLEDVADGWDDESEAVQVEVLTAAAKLFFKRPPEVQALLGSVLSKACGGTASHEVRDRALLFYRLLRLDPVTASTVIAGNKPEPTSTSMTADLTDRLLDEFDTYSVVFQTPGERFATWVAGDEASEADEEAAADEEEEEDNDQVLVAEPTPAAPGEAPSSPSAPTPPRAGSMADLPPLRLSPLCPMDDSTFEARWGELPAARTAHLTLRSCPPAILLASTFARHNIAPLAGGEVGGCLKYFFKAGVEGSTPEAPLYYLAEVVIKPTVKTTDTRADAFVELLNDAARRFM